MTAANTGGQRTGGAQGKAGANSRPELEPQPRNEGRVQGRRNLGQYLRRSISRVLTRAAEQGDATRDGAADAGTQDRQHHSEDLEERRSVRFRKIEDTSSLSAKCHRNAEPPSRSPSATERSGSSAVRHGLNPKWMLTLTGHRMFPRTTQQSNRPRVSDRTMVGKLPTLLKGAQKPDGTTAEEYGSENLLWKRKSKTTLRQKVSRLQTGA